MGLVKCPDCEKMFSDRISACPDCGCPIEEALKEMDKSLQEYQKEPVQTVEVSNEIFQQEADDEKNVFDIDKSALMTSEELEEFAFRSILPTINKELDGKISEVQKCNENTESVGYYLFVDAEVIGLDVVVDVAPCFRHSICNWKHAEQMHKKGYKYAVAQIGVGARDPLRFETRVVLKEDEYIFRYEKLHYYDYGKTQDIRITIGERDYSFIYENDGEKTNPYMLKKERESYYSMYVGSPYVSALREFWDMYSLPQKSLEFHIKFIKSLAEGIDYHLPLKTLVLNFWYCVNSCKGLLYANSFKLSKRKIIPTCYEILDSNRELGLSYYEKYTFAYFVYYYLQNDEYNETPESSGYMNRQKIKLFEEKPIYFGFEELSRRKTEKKNSYESIFHMMKIAREFVSKDFPEYMRLNAQVNNDSLRKLVDFGSCVSKIEQMEREATNRYYDLSSRFDVKEAFEKKNVYIVLERILDEYRKLLKKEYWIFKKLSAKSAGGKYGYFEYRKDLKERAEYLDKIIPLYEELKCIQTEKNISEKIKVMVKVHSKLVEEIRSKYLEAVKDIPSKYAEFKEELCRFHNYALSAPFEDEYREERRMFMACIEEFIELIELQECNPVDEDSIYDKEESLLVSIDKVRDNMFKFMI